AAATIAPPEAAAAAVAPIPTAPILGTSTRASASHNTRRLRSCELFDIVLSVRACVRTRCADTCTGSVALTAELSVMLLVMLLHDSPLRSSSVEDTVVPLMLALALAALAAELLCSRGVKPPEVS